MKRIWSSTIILRTCRRRAFISKVDFLLAFTQNYLVTFFYPWFLSHSQLTRPTNLGCFTSWSADGEATKLSSW